MQFQDLIKKIAPKLKGIAYKLKRQSVYFQEDDLYQEAVLRLWQDFNAGKLKDKTDSYILQGCYFHLKNYIRSHKPKTRLLSWESLYSFNEDDNSGNNPPILEIGLRDYREEIDIKLLADTIRNNGLTRREKEILSYYAQGLTTRDIGKRLAISHVRVVKLTKVIRQKCSKYLDNT